MTENQIKEALSKIYLQSIVNYLGYKLESPSNDHGCDCSIIEVTKINQAGKIRFLDSGRRIDIQLKATTDTSVSMLEDYLKFDLEVKTYKDLIFRLKGTNLLVLVVFILPQNREEWLNCTEEELILKKNAFWYIPSDIEDEVSNNSKIRIKIPLENRLSFNSVKKLFDIQYN